MKGAAVVRGFRFVGALLACGVCLAGCSAGFGSEAEGVSVQGSPAVATAESSVESPSVFSPDGATVSSEFKRPRDSNGKPIWIDGVVGRGYVIPPQPKTAPPLPQWVKDFNPEMPEAARQPTEAGAKAFAEYAFASDFYEFNTGSTTIRRAIASAEDAARAKQLDNLDSAALSGRWGRIQKFAPVSAQVRASQDGKYIIDFKYEMSSLIDNSSSRDSGETQAHTGAISVFYDKTYGWQVFQISYSENGLVGGDRG